MIKGDDPFIDQGQLRPISLISRKSHSQTRDCGESVDDMTVCATTNRLFDF